MVDKLLLECKDFKELKLNGDINVWGTDQKTLEKQALKELETFADNNNADSDNIEDGEIVETENSAGDIKKTKEISLDIETYIKKQQEFKKRQEYKKSLEISSHSKELAEKVSQKNRLCSRKPKRIKRNSGNEINNICTKNSIQNNEENEKVIDVCESGVEKEESDGEKSGSEYIPTDGEFDTDYEECTKLRNEIDGTRILVKRKRKCQLENFEKVVDDGLLICYQKRLDEYYKQLESEIPLSDDLVDGADHHSLKGGLNVPLKLWQNLYSYQQDGIKWLWSIHKKTTGGLLGDEMGLGKTVQVIVFFSALEYSKFSSCHGRFKGLGPSLIVCPATVIHQWVKHFHEWAPEFRVAVLHQSGNYQGNKANLIKDMVKCKGILITTYLGILKYKGNLLEHNWHYVVLDEGHKIRNPTAKVSIAVKQIHTPHRILLTGSPMQNNLTELWSLFDFTNPSMLGNLMTFQEHFANPILHGGFANSTPMQEATALSVATTLKNVITPYLLRRSKEEVQDDILLPQKSEQVLFCSLTPEQRDLYKGYLMSEHVNMILGRGVKNWYSENYMKANMLVAITTLRKICNHPDIYLNEADEHHEDDKSTPTEDRFGYYKRSGKMVVVSALLKIWKKQGHRVLLFTQGRAMISIFQDFLEQQSYKYLKMDGSTVVNTRQSLIDKFNQDSSYEVFLLTTRVGGLGINLTGANRVIIFDPDWNPATDTQARERAWRIGQDKEVTIYRLLSAGTIEEKIYQRQVWKQLLSNKVLLDPRTNRFFKTSDLHDLFSLQESTDSNPETANIFRDSRVKIEKKIKQQKNKKKKSKTVPEVEFTEDKILAMKNLAQQIAKSFSQKEQPLAPKTAFQTDLEFERQEKLKQKLELKKLTAQELLHYNKDKANQKEDNTINKVDDCETSVSFSSALEYSEKTAKLHNTLVSGKVKNPEIIVKKFANIQKDVVKTSDDNTTMGNGIAPSSSKKDTGITFSARSSVSESSLKYSNAEQRNKKCKKKRHKHKSVIDASGTIEGEEVEGLVKTEIKKVKNKKGLLDSTKSQDNFILGKLFSKKGVSGALQHDLIVQSGCQGKSIRIRTEAQLRAEKSLEALRKSRLDNWRCYRSKIPRNVVNTQLT